MDSEFNLDDYLLDASDFLQDYEISSGNEKSIIKTFHFYFFQLFIRKDQEFLSASKRNFKQHFARGENLSTTNQPKAK